MNRFFACAAGFTAALGTLAAVADEAPQTPSKPAVDLIEVGKELFHREWLPNDPRSHGGDGLGPVFNESSCVACHNQGGVGGGGGAASNNIAVLSFTSVMPTDKFTEQQRDQLLSEHSALRSHLGLDSVAVTSANLTAVVIHRFGLSD